MVHLKEELTKFLKTTSIKGVPKVFQVRNTFLRILWAMSIIGFFATAFFQVIYSLLDYLKYETITVINEQRQGSTVFPSITLCNIQPFDYDRIEKYGYIKPEEYFSKVDYYVSKMHELNTSDREELKTSLRDIGGYFSFLGIENAKRVGFEKNDFIIDCNYIELDGELTIKRKCEDFGDIVLTQQPPYLNCYNINLKAENSNKGVDAMTVLLHIADHFKSDIIQSRGAVFAIHDKYGAPSMSLNGLTLSTNTFTSVYSTVEERKRQGKPYGDCTDEERLKDYRDFAGSEIAYSVSTCEIKKIHDSIISKCKCQDVHSLIYKPSANVSFCHKMDEVFNIQNLRDILQNSRCIQKVYEELGSLYTCIPRCRSKSYTNLLSKSDWPIKSSVLNLYQQFIKPHPLGKYFKIYENATNINSVVSDLLENNLIKVEIVRKLI
ncbi:DgyrCDS5473 [Dimorphilus gyrociliatus]|uniref:DgyrCDS5473 n=1 Tax=Dimorphilus gyrociliatus TaxID=2664684 RepID=A0A7I8VJZ0_9ANNE|nr:DgyrCDS5473 [Dimorphilus gyrociliatus]